MKIENLKFKDILVYLGFIILLASFVESVSPLQLGAAEQLPPDYSELIRFHVLANSNSPDDQELKLKVRDLVLQKVQKDLYAFKDREEAYDYLLNRQEYLEKETSRYLEGLGYDYEVQVEVGSKQFPARRYRNEVVPEGEYLSFQVIIGEGEGDNWWCVLFPPLCYVDMTVMNEDQPEKNDDLKVKFLIWEYMKQVFQ